MRRIRVYVDTSTIGGSEDARFAEFINAGADRSAFSREMREKFRPPGHP